MNAEAIFIVMAVIGFLLFLTGWIIGCAWGEKTITKCAQLEAVKHGKGEYYLDKNHERKFRWKP